MTPAPEPAAGGTAICLIARTNSTRLPRKVLQPVGDATLIELLMRRLAQSRLARSVVLCTSTHPDDAVLLELARANGIEALAGSEDEPLDRLLDAARLTGATSVVRVTGDDPLIDGALCDRLIELHERVGADYTRVEGVPLGLSPEVMRVDALVRCRETLPAGQSEYLTVFMFDPDRYRCAVLGWPEDLSDYSLTVDYPADYERLLGIVRDTDGSIPAILDHVRGDATCRISREELLKMPGGTRRTYGAFRAWMEERAGRSHLEAA
jgi:spore coat polysaccharide biosynthesis protein SpsF (cytidylyltransferase family)